MRLRFDGRRRLRIVPYLPLFHFAIVAALPLIIKGRLKDSESTFYAMGRRE
jgi:hypothetical protein